jgi:hypothetical protein
MVMGTGHIGTRIFAAIVSAATARRISSACFTRRLVPSEGPSASLRTGWRVVVDISSLSAFDLVCRALSHPAPCGASAGPFRPEAL